MSCWWRMMNRCYRRMCVFVSNFPFFFCARDKEIKGNCEKKKEKKCCGRSRWSHPMRVCRFDGAYVSIQTEKKKTTFGWEEGAVCFKWPARGRMSPVSTLASLCCSWKQNKKRGRTRGKGGGGGVETMRDEGRDRGRRKEEVWVWKKKEKTLSQSLTTMQSALWQRHDVTLVESQVWGWEEALSGWSHTSILPLPSCATLFFYRSFSF